MKNSIFFEPPSRLQLLDKLKHMVRFSDFLLLVSGDRGTGKSTLVEHLQPDLKDTTLCCCIIRPEGALSQEQLVDNLLSQLPSHHQVSADFSGRLKALYLQVKAMRESGQKCLIIVDDAENLDRPALDLLLNLHLSDSSSESAQLLLLMGNDFAEQLVRSKAIKSLEGRVHHLTLEKMSVEEIGEYISLCHPSSESLDQKKKAQLIQLSEGLPGRVDTLLAGGRVSSQSGKPGTRTFPLPAVHMGGIGLVLVAILAISLWQFFPEDNSTPGEASSEVLSVPLPVSVTMSDKKVAETKTQELRQPVSINEDTGSRDAEIAQQKLVNAKDDLVKKIEQQEKMLVVSMPAQESLEVEGKKAAVEDIESELRQVVEKANQKEQAKKNTSVVETPPSVASIKVDEPEIVKPKQTKKPVQQKYSTTESAILKWDASGYTLQMLGARSKKSALDFINRQKDSANLYYFSTLYKGAPWHVVIYGQFANRDIANATVKKLPVSLRNMKPWARSVSGVQIDIKKK
ncbi:MAG: SPOR domain-containing protein [Neptuniibacter sp.]